MDWENLGYVKASSHRIALVKALEGNPKTPKELTQLMNTHFSQTTSTLRELSEKGIVVCLNPEATKGKLYTLTDLGKSLMEYL